MTKANQITEKQIRARAYQLYVERGRLPGHAMDDWLQAEYELMQLPIHKIAELEHPPSGDGHRRRSVVALVQAALLLGAEALPHLEHSFNWKG